MKVSSTVFITASLLAAAASSVSALDYYTELNGLKCTAARYLKPTTVDDIKAAVSSSSSIRILGARHSSSEILCAGNNGTALDMSGFTSVSVDANARTATAGAGALLSDVQGELFKQKLSLEHTTLFGGITIGGGMGTGAHGSSLVHATNLGEQTVSLKVVRADGSVATITGDELRFYRPHLGLLGVIYEVTLRAVPLFKVQADVTEYDESILPNIGHLAAGKDLYQVIWYPSVKTVVTYTAQYMPIDAVGEGGFLNMIPNVNQIELNFYQLLLKLGPLSWCPQEYEAKQALLGRSLVRPSMLLNNNRPSTTAVGYPHQMIVSSCQKDKCPWTVMKTISFGVALPLSRAADAVNIIRDIRRKYPECFPLIGVFFRFAKAASSQYSAAAVELGRDTLHIEVEPPIDGASHPFYAEFMRRMVSEAEGRLHWGKNLEFGKANFDVSDFTAYMKQVDPKGLFQNSWSQTIFA
ncbi:FAD-binding domain-containing protein [Ramicandelaber brevisporus]|nr:FAD-binding domain-containing protein [Ramicandelaber brevisporus]